MALFVRVAFAACILLNLSWPVASQAQPTAQKTLGIISVLGETFTVKRVGSSLGADEESEFPIDGWRFDTKTADFAKSLLAKNFKIKTIPIKESAFTALAERADPAKDPEAALAAFIQKFAASSKCDYYLLISRGVSEYSNDGQSVNGLGVVRGKSTLFGERDIVHALTMLRVYDANFKLLRTERGTMGQSNFLATVRGPNIALHDEKRLPVAADAAFADPRAKELTWQLLEKSLATTLPKLFAAD
jgi:hypothetical protein